MARKIGIKDIDLALKAQAKAEKQTFGQHLQTLADMGELSPDIYDANVKDASGETVPAWKQVMVNANINPKTRGAATVNEAFFVNNADRILFPLYIEERYREQGRETRNGLSLDDLVADVQEINNTVVQTMLLSFKDDENADLSRIAEGAEYPELTITQGNAVVTLFKEGGRLSASLEALTMASLSTFDRWLLKVSRQATRNKVRRALNILRNGDGNNNPAPNVNAAAAALTHADFVALLMTAEGFGAEPSIITGDSVSLGALLNLPSVKDAGSNNPGANVLQTQGNFPMVYGMQPKLPPQRSVLSGTRQLMAIDPTAGLTMYVNPAFDLVRYEEIMRRDLQVVQITEMMGFGKPDEGAAITLTIPA